MSPGKILLYPFSIHRPYFYSYAWAVELSVRMHARLQLFTTTTAGMSPDPIYDSLLEANGYYLAHYHREGIKVNEVKYTPTITSGELKEELMLHLKNNPVDIVIVDSSFSSPKDPILFKIIEQSGGVIMLSTGSADSNQSTTDHFYDLLRHAHFFKLSEKFFDTLGGDRSVFNYLRKFFQR